MLVWNKFVVKLALLIRKLQLKIQKANKQNIMILTIIKCGKKYTHMKLVLERKKIRRKIKINLFRILLILMETIVT